MLAVIGSAAWLVVPSAFGMPPGKLTADQVVARSVDPISTEEVNPEVPPDIPEYAPPAVSLPRPPLYAVPRSMRVEDHLYFTRPIQSGQRNWSHASYRYGSTLMGRDPLHTGVDMAVDTGTPVIAAGPGYVIWTGYGFYRGAYDPDDNYGLAVAIQHDFGYRGQNLYTVYGHLSSIAVWPGQHVEMGEVIGAVGSTGRSTGPHLHFEVRLGDKIYSSTQNPELWMSVPEGWGVLAGRLENDWGQPLLEQYMRIVSLDTSEQSYIWTYASELLGRDPVYGENFAISDLPAGRYRLEVEYRWRIYTAQIDLLPGQTTFIVFRGRSGFIVEPEIADSDWIAPNS
jgi:hypothetical protein